MKTFSLRAMFMALIIFTTTSCAPVAPPSVVTSTELIQPTAPERIPSYYYAQGQRVEVNIATDLVAVIEDASTRSAPSENFLAADESFNRDDELNAFRQEGVYFVQVEDTLAPAAFATRQAGIEERFDAPQTGIVVYLADSTFPLVATDEIIVKFKAEVDAAQQNSLHEQLGAEVIRADRYVKNQFIVRKKADTKTALDVANAYFESGLVEFAHPNFIVPVEDRQVIDDPLYPNQWHLDNSGQGGGVADADVDAPEAWAITQGDSSIVIAVIDKGVQISHEDLIDNRFINPGEIEGNNLDDDGNGYIDDISGWNFYENTPNTDRGFDGRHGTAVAGVAVARGNNQLGGSGICPHCLLLPIARGSKVEQQAEAIRYAAAMGAAIITNSWGYKIGTPLPDVVVNAINESATQGRHGLGTVIFFAMNNEEIDNCQGSTPDISSLVNVIAISGSTNQDRLGHAGFGDCMELLAPTRGGTLGITTINQGGGYQNNFGGTSSATPLVAGIAGLMLQTNPALTRSEVQQILQATADKIEALVAQYGDQGFSPTHGYGRVNAARAVTAASDLHPDSAQLAPLTTLLIVRHAEVDVSVDPPVLTPAGSIRSFQLANTLEQAGISGIYASSTPATQATVQPLANRLGLPIVTIDNATALIANIIAEHAGEVILVAQHSVSIPGLIAEIGGDPTRCRLAGGFDNLCVVYIAPPNLPHLLNLKYGDPSPLIVAPPVEPPSGNVDTNTARDFTVEVKCSNTQLRTAVAILTWQSEERSIELQRPSVTVYKNGFAKGLFATLPLSSGERMFERFDSGERADERAFDLPLRLFVTDVEVDWRGDDGLVSVQIEGLEPGLNYFWQVTTPIEERWSAGEIVRVEAPVCPADMQEEQP